MCVHRIHIPCELPTVRSKQMTLTDRLILFLFGLLSEWLLSGPAYVHVMICTNRTEQRIMLHMKRTNMKNEPVLLTMQWSQDNSNMLMFWFTDFSIKSSLLQIIFSQITRICQEALNYLTVWLFAPCIVQAQSTLFNEVYYKLTC